MRVSLRGMQLGVPTSSTAGLLPFLDAFTRADGSLGNGWLYVEGAWAIVDGSAIATPTVGSELVTNGRMESGDPPTGWTPLNSATFSAAADERTGGIGTQSLNAAIASGNPLAVAVVGGVVASDITQLEAWGKNVSTTQVAIWGSAIDLRKTETEWIRLTGSEFGRNNVSLVGLGSSGNECRFDDVSIRKITRNTTIAARNFGVTNIRVGIGYTQPLQSAVGVVVALDDAATVSNAIIAYQVGSRILVDKITGGTTRTNLSGMLTVTPTDTRQLALEIADGIVRAFYNGTQIGVDYRVTDAGLLGNLHAGMFSTHPDNSIDSVSAIAVNPIALNGSNTALFTVSVPAADLFTGTAPDDWLGRPVLCNDGTKWSMIYKVGANHTPAAGDAFVIRFSEDEGATWTDVNTFTDGNPVSGFPLQKDNGISDAIILQAPNGDLLVQGYAHTQIGTYQWRSTNGGASWTDEGVIDDGDEILVGGQDYVVVGSDIYIVYQLIKFDLTTVVPSVWKSSDNGATWAKVGNIEINCGESGIAYLGGTSLLVVMRDNNALATYQSRSDDMGVTWQTSTVIPDMGVFQRPRLHSLAGGVMMVGRAGAGVSTSTRTCVYYTSDQGAHWGRRFIPDAGTGSDTGYCDVLERADGSFYIATYGGSMAVATIRRTVFTIA